MPVCESFGDALYFPRPLRRASVYEWKIIRFFLEGKEQRWNSEGFDPHQLPLGTPWLVPGRNVGLDSM